MYVKNHFVPDGRDSSVVPLVPKLRSSSSCSSIVLSGFGV